MSLVFILLIVYGSFFLYLIWNKKNKSITGSHAVEKKIDFTILIPFKDEENQLSTLIECIEGVDYKRGNLEFIFINDHSNDSGRELLLQRIQKISQVDIQLLDLVDSHGKKQAIKYGVSQAKYEHIIQIDADVSFKKDYLESVARSFTQVNTHLVLGSVKMSKRENLLGILQQSEFFAIMALTYYTAECGIPILANGANMAYTKKLFNLAESRRNDYKLSSGDDVFLLYTAKKMKDFQIVFNKEEEGQVNITPEKGISGFIAQRVRWAQKSKHYKDNNAQIIGLLIVLVNIVLLCLFIAAIFQQVEWIYFLMVFIMKWLMDLLLLSSYDSTQNRLLLILDTLLLSIFYPIYTNSIAFLSLLYRPYWKGRKIQ